MGLNTPPQPLLLCMLQNQLESDLVTVQDYLACTFRNLVTQSTLTLENFMDNAKLTLFEQAVAGVQTQVILLSCCIRLHNAVVGCILPGTFVTSH